MIKQLLLVSLILFVFANTHAQTDTTVARPVGATIKHKAPVRLVKKKPADTAAKHAHTSGAMKDPASKNRLVDSTAKPRVKNTTKPAAADAVAIIHSPIKTLSDERYNALIKGDDFDNMAMAGELNHYPLPDKALKYKVQLGLNPGQITKLKEIVTGLHRKKVEMGDYMIKNEKMLDSIFHSKRVDDGTLIFYTNRYGLYMGELRNAILQACYKTEAILSEVQIRKLESLEQAVK